MFYAIDFSSLNVWRLREGEEDYGFQPMEVSVDCRQGVPVESLKFRDKAGTLETGERNKKCPTQLPAVRGKNNFKNAK
ncbi:MAG: hypothetical protein LBP50_07330 [Tannerella sp.]|nr:hypothetical protein [Tannerella sp.]